jgi:hypothetical protein
MVSLEWLMIFNVEKQDKKRVDIFQILTWVINLSEWNFQFVISVNPFQKKDRYWLIVFFCTFFPKGSTHIFHSNDENLCFPNKDFSLTLLRSYIIYFWEYFENKTQLIRKLMIFANVFIWHHSLKSLK